MYCISQFEIDKVQIEEGAKALKEVRFLLEQAALVPNSLEDEIEELFRELAALKGQSVNETVEEIEYGITQYLEAAMMPEPETDSLAENISFCYEQMKKISRSIESCWDLFSNETRIVFIQSASEYREQRKKKLEGWQGLYRRGKLIIPSIISRTNLFAKYKQIYFLLPDAVDRALALRQGKIASSFSSAFELLAQRVKKEKKRRPGLLSSLENLGQDRDDQIQKNQAAMAWAKARLKELEEKRARNKVEM